jgi:hypothetical protein
MVVNVARFFGDDGFIIDNADSPTQWKGFDLDNDNASSHPDDHLRMVSAVAEAADISPQDRLDEVAPAILRTEFKYHDSWSRSPDAIFHFHVVTARTNHASTTLPSGSLSTFDFRGTALGWMFI